MFEKGVHHQNSMTTRTILPVCTESRRSPPTIDREVVTLAQKTALDIEEPEWVKLAVWKTVFHGGEGCPC